MLREQGADDVLVTVGGTIPADDIPELKKLGVAEVFTPGSPTDDIVDFLRNGVGRRLARRLRPYLLLDPLRADQRRAELASVVGSRFRTPT